MSAPEEGIIKILAFFHVLGRGVTTIELTRLQNNSVSETMRVCASLAITGRVYVQDGFWHLFGCERKKNVQDDPSHNMWRRVKKLIPLFAINPFIEAVAVANSLPMHTVKEDSDIDLFIVCKKNRLYLARFFLVTLLKILRLRPGETRNAPVCASFFVDSAYTDYGRLAITDDIYLSHWVSSLIWVYDPKSRGKEVMHALVPLTAQFELSAFYETKQFSSPTFTKFFCALLRSFDSLFLERFVRMMQLYFLPQSLQDAIIAQHSGVAIDAYIFKTHLHDRRALFRDAWRKVCAVS